MPGCSCVLCKFGQTVHRTEAQQCAEFVYVVDRADLHKNPTHFFAQRRKTLLNALSAVFGDRADKTQLAAVLAEAGLAPDIRGEKLGIEEFANLTKKMININLKTEEHHV